MVRDKCTIWYHQFPRRVASEMNVWLIHPPSEEEIRLTLFGMKKNTPPGPNGLTIEFYQMHWDLVKKNLLDLVVNFFRGRLSMTYFNSTFFMLVPKIEALLS